MEPFFLYNNRQFILKCYNKVVIRRDTHCKKQKEKNIIVIDEQGNKLKSTYQKRTKNPIQSICETNNKMIDLLRDIYSSLQPNQNYSTTIIEGLINSLNNAIENDCGVETIKFIVTTIKHFEEK